MTQPAFHRLSEELLVMIMQNLLKEEERWMARKKNCDRLKSLRLACPQYAHSPKLLGILFYKVRLVGSPESLPLLESTAELDVIGLYVKHVTFDPGRYCWTVTEEFARNVILARALYGFSGKDDFGRSVLTEDRIRQLRVQDLPPEHRGEVSDRNVHRHFEAYMQNAHEVRRLHESGRFRLLWAEALRRLPRAEKFYLAGWDCSDAFEVSDPANVMCRHYHGPSLHGKNDCNPLQAPPCEAMVQSALSALGDAKMKIKHLDWDAVPDGEFVWADNGLLDHLDFSELHALEFKPHMEEPSSRWPGEVEVRIEQRCGLAVTELLKRCAATLKRLDMLPLLSRAPAKFPLSENDIVTLPVLEYLEVNAILDLTNFATFVARATSLKELILPTNGARRDCGEWREVWRVVRYHPSRMRVHSEQLPCHSAFEAGFDIDTNRSGDEQFDCESDPLHDLNRSLGNYMSGAGKWNESCRMFFEEGGGEQGAVSSEDDLSEDD